MVFLQFEGMVLKNLIHWVRSFRTPADLSSSVFSVLLRQQMPLLSTPWETAKVSMSQQNNKPFLQLFSSYFLASFQIRKKRHIETLSDFKINLFSNFCRQCTLSIDKKTWILKILAWQVPRILLMELLQYYIRLLSFVKTNIFVETFDDRLQHVLNDNDDGAKGPNLDCCLNKRYLS